MRDRGCWVLVIVLASVLSVRAAEPAGGGKDPRNIVHGLPIPDEGYCDQPYVVVTLDGNWLCVLTTGKGEEGQRGQHVVSTISKDRGKTWSKLVDIEPASGPEASWAVPLLTPGGRVYAFYDFNGDKVDNLNGKKIRADMLGWFVYRYSDDFGQTWSKERQRLPMRLTAADRGNDWQGKVQIFWGICKPQVADKEMLFSFTKLGKYMLDQGEGFVYRSDNILREKDPAKIRWDLWPDGDHGIRSPGLGSVQEEHNLAWLGGQHWYCVYRTTTGYPAHTYSADGGKTWDKPEPMTYAPGGKQVKNPRACPKLFRTANGNFLFWYHNHSGKSFQDRNPAWISGGVLKDGRIVWSQPEILFYDNDPKVRMSYPDLIEQEGRFWITETQKTVARVHEIDKTLLEGLWHQGTGKVVAAAGKILDLDAKQAQAKEVPIEKRLDLARSGGLSLDVWVELKDLAAGQVLLDNRDAEGRGLVLFTSEGGALRIEIDDGKAKASWDSDRGLLKMGKPQHVVVTIDAGPKVITIMVNGVLCDGGADRQFGWGRWPGAICDVSGTGKLRLGPSLQGELKRLRVYERYLRTSEAVAHFHAGP